jgi:hypothetical protein
MQGAPNCRTDSVCANQDSAAIGLPVGKNSLDITIVRPERDQLTSQAQGIASHRSQQRFVQRRSQDNARRAAKRRVKSTKSPSVDVADIRARGCDAALRDGLCNSELAQRRQRVGRQQHAESELAW